MVDVSRKYDAIVFTVRGWDKLFAFKSILEIPVEHIVAAYADSDIPALHLLSRCEVSCST